MSDTGFVALLERRAEELRSEIALLQAKLEEIEETRIALAQGLDREHRSRERSADRKAPKTIKEMVVDTLERRGRKGRASDILEWIESDFSRPLERTSLSPQLSRLRSEGCLNYDGRTKEWSLHPTSPRVAQENS